RAAPAARSLFPGTRAAPGPFEAAGRVRGRLRGADGRQSPRRNVGSLLAKRSCECTRMRKGELRKRAHVEPALRTACAEPARRTLRSREGYRIRRLVGSVQHEPFGSRKRCAQRLPRRDYAQLRFDVGRVRGRVVDGAVARNVAGSSTAYAAAACLNASPVAWSAGKNASIASSDSVMSTGVPKTVIVLN